MPSIEASDEDDLIKQHRRVVRAERHLFHELESLFNRFTTEYLVTHEQFLGVLELWKAQLILHALGLDTEEDDEASSF